MIEATDRRSCHFCVFWARSIFLVCDHHFVGLDFVGRKRREWPAAFVFLNIFLQAIFHKTVETQGGTINSWFSRAC